MLGEGLRLGLWGKGWGYSNGVRKVRVSGGRVRIRVLEGYGVNLSIHIVLKHLYILGSGLELGGKEACRYWN